MPVPVSSLSLRSSWSATPLSSEVELPWQVRLIRPPATAASPTKNRNGGSAASCAGHAVLLLPISVLSFLVSCVQRRPTVSFKPSVFSLLLCVLKALFLLFWFLVVF